jgi:rhodanese-related sulfurtransferase
MIRALSFTLAFAFCGVLLAAPKEEKSKDGVLHVDSKAAAKLLATKEKGKKPVILDIRTPAEFKGGHLKAATNIDFNGDDFEDELAKLDKNKPYLVHCRSGGRSTASLAAFKKLGFKNIYHLDGGILAWKKAEHEVVK